MLYLLRNGWRNLALVLVLLLIALCQYVRLQKIELEKTKVLAENPLVITKTKVVRVQGPEKIKVVKVTEPSGTVTETKEIVKEETTVTTGEENTIQPLQIQETPGTKWVLGGGIIGTSRDEREFLFYGGRTVMNHVDFCVGATTKERVSAILSVRF